MFVARSLAQARRSAPLAVLLAVAVFAQPVLANDENGVALDLDEAARLAITDQPLLDALSAQGQAAHASGIAARQLPDPQLTVGLMDLPVNGGEAYSLTRDSDTQARFGLTQEFPREAKRQLRGQLLEREADRLSAEQHLAQRTIRRDAALAWIELWRYDQTLQLSRASLREAQTQMQAVEIALKTGTATQADYLSARQDVNRLQDAVRAAEQSIGHARNGLSRWIGEAAFRPICPDLPPTPVLPNLDAVLDRVGRHPHLAGAQAEVAAAETGAALAKAAYKPDWRVELAYAERQRFSDEVTLQVGIDLPLFTRSRQDQGLAAALAKRDAAQLAVEDHRRELLAEARLNYTDYSVLIERLQDYDRTLLPQSDARIEASLAGWRAGRAQFRDVLDARRAALEIRMARLDLQTDLAKHTTNLTYLGAFEPVSGTGETAHE